MLKIVSFLIVHFFDNKRPCESPSTFLTLFTANAVALLALFRAHIFHHSFRHSSGSLGEIFKDHRNPRKMASPCLSGPGLPVAPDDKGCTPLRDTTLSTSLPLDYSAPLPIEANLQAGPQVQTRDYVLDAHQLVITPATIASLAASPIPSMPLDLTFHPFSRLATELRSQIWGFALPTPVTVPLECHIDEHSTVPMYFMERDGLAYFNEGRRWQRSTSLLRVCFESKEIYVQEFPHTLPFVAKGGCCYPQVLRFGDKDAFYFTNLEFQLYDRAFWRVLKREMWVKEIRTMWLHEDLFFFFDIKKWIALLKHFTGLELVVGVEVGEDKNRERIGIWVREVRDLLVVENVKGLKVPAMTFKGNDLERAMMGDSRGYLEEKMRRLGFL